MNHNFVTYNETSSDEVLPVVDTNFEQTVLLREPNHLCVRPLLERPRLTETIKLLLSPFLKVVL